MPTPLEQFVNKHYAAANRPGVLKRLKTSGFVPPAARAGGATPSAPGGTVDVGSIGGLTRAQRRTVPNELLGVAGIRGPFLHAPNLNPNDFEVVPNRFGAFWARPVTETSGLSGPQLHQVSAFDEATARQQPVIQGAYSDLGGALRTNADETANRLGQLGSLIQSSPVYGSQPVGAPAGLGTDLANARRNEVAAKDAVTVGQMSALPSLAAIEGTRALTAYQASRQTGHSDLLGSLRELNLKAQQDALKQQSDTASLNAQLRGQDLQLLGTQISQQGGLQRALVNNASDERQNLGRLQNAYDIAIMRGDVSTANSIRQTAASIQKSLISASTSANKPKKAPAGAPGTPQYQTNKRNYVNGLQGYFFDSAGNPKPGAGTRGAFARGLALGLSPADVLRAIRSLESTYGEDSHDAREIAEALISSGMARSKAQHIATRLTGHDLVAPGSA